MKNKQNNNRTNKSHERWASLAYKYNCTSIIIMYDERLTFEADKSRQQSKRSAVIYNIYVNILSKSSLCTKMRTGLDWQITSSIRF